MEDNHFSERDYLNDSSNKTHNKYNSNSNGNSNNNNFDLKSNRITKLIDLRNSQDNTKNLYENIGQRVLKIRKDNDFYEKSIIQTENQIKLLKERIEAKRSLLENTMQGHQKPKTQIKLHDANWMNDFYYDQLNKNELKMTINKHHIDNDPSLHKAEKKKGVELSQLQTNHNSYIKKIAEIQNDIDVLRKENNKLKDNLASIVSNKDKQNKEMSKISEEANQYLRKKTKFNEELVKINQKIDADRVEHEAKMKELNKMIDNTKKIKQFNETLAIEKYSNRTSRGDGNGPIIIPKLIEEQQKLKVLNDELIKAKRIRVYLHFKKLIQLRKQNENNEIIAKVKRETGIDNLDKLNSDLELSKETNLKFDKDLKELYQQKEELEHNIEIKTEELHKAQDILNDDHTRVEQYINQLKCELKEINGNKKQLNKRFYALNKLIGLIAKVFKSFYDKVNKYDKAPDVDFDAKRNEDIIMSCMELFERKMIDIIQMNGESVKDMGYGEQDETKNMNLIKKISEGINHEEHEKLFDKKKCVQANFNLRDIKDISKEMVNNYIKKYDSYK